MIGRIFLFGSAVVSVLLLTLIYAIVSGQYLANQPVPSPTAGGAAPSAAASGTAVVVTIANLGFGPDLTVAAGTSVTFMNNDVVPHTATNGRNGIPASGSLFNLPLAVGASESYMFTGPGTYQVTCTFHPFMNMIVTAQ